MKASPQMKAAIERSRKHLSGYKGDLNQLGLNRYRAHEGKPLVKINVRS